MTVWLTPGEAANHVRLKNTRLIMQAIKDGDLRCYRAGKTYDVRHVRIKMSDLDDWMESKPGDLS